MRLLPIGEGEYAGDDPFHAAGTLADRPLRRPRRGRVRRARDPRQRLAGHAVSALVLSVLGASLLGSPHCAAMCGGFVCFFSGQGGRRPSALTHASYHAGRLAAYALLGAAAGTAGAGFDLAGRMAGFQRPAAVAAGTAHDPLGSRHARRRGGILARRHGRPAGVPPPPRPRARGARHTATGRARRSAVGLLTALLPCGWLYVFVATAAGTGSAGSGALVMSRVLGRHRAGAGGGRRPGPARRRPAPRPAAGRSPRPRCSCSAC